MSLSFPTKYAMAAGLLLATAAPLCPAQTGAAPARPQPWGSGNALDTKWTHVHGPTVNDARVCVTDTQFGAPQVICNEGAVNGTSQRFQGSSPIFAQNIITMGNGISPHSPQALSIQFTSFAGGRDLPDDESYLVAQKNLAISNTSGSFYNYFSRMEHYGLGDSIPIYTDAFSTGQGLRQNEGLEWRARFDEMGNVMDARLNSVNCAVTCTFSMTQTEGDKGSFGDDLALIDLTHGYNQGYIASINGGTFTGAGANWDSTFGDTTAETRTTAAVDDASTGNRNLNVFPQKNVTLHVADSSGFSAGQVACMFDSREPSWQCSHVTSVGAGTITVDRMNYPLNEGSTVAAGGLTGYGFGMDADWVERDDRNGFGGSDAAPNGTIRQVYPIVSNSAGDKLTIFTPGGVNGIINTRAYLRMGGSGGTASVTLSGGAVTSCSATGGSGYIGTDDPPQLILSGITYTKAPVIYVSSIRGGMLAGCTVASAGSGISGNPEVRITPTNAYHIYPQARTYDVYNGTTGAVDGSQIVTTPAVGTFSPGDDVEQPHYFHMKIEGLNMQTSMWQEGGQHQNLFINTSGSFGNNDYEAMISNVNDPTVYFGYPVAPEPYIVGRGELTTPYGIALGGPHRNGLWMQLPPYGGNGGSRMGAVVVSCGTPAQCAGWNEFYTLLNANNDTQGRNIGEDVVGYNPATQTWKMTAGATGSGGAGASCTYSFGPHGLSSSGPGCGGAAMGGDPPAGSTAADPPPAVDPPPLAATTPDWNNQGSAIAPSSCVNGPQVNVRGATRGMGITVTPEANPGLGLTWNNAYVAHGSLVQVVVCNVTPGAIQPAITAYNVRIIP